MAAGVPEYPLRDGPSMPAVGLGLYRASPGREAERAVTWALELGYRLFDTASLYGNEASVGRAVRASQVPREEVFLTTKVWNSEQGYRETLNALDASLDRLQMDYVDLYLIHWPVQEKRLDTWRALVELRDRGLCRSIGVSNYMVQHLVELEAHSDVMPTVNQIELSPFNYESRRPVVERCQEEDIVVEAYSPLTKGRKLRDSQLGAVAAEVGCTPAQVLLRWGLQHEFVVIPKSTNRTHQAENLALFEFELSEDQMGRLDRLDQNLATGWDPTGKP